MKTVKCKYLGFGYNKYNNNIYIFLLPLSPLGVWLKNVLLQLSLYCNIFAAVLAIFFAVLLEGSGLSSDSTLLVSILVSSKTKETNDNPAILSTRFISEETFSHMVSIWQKNYIIQMKKYVVLV